MVRPFALSLVGTFRSDLWGAFLLATLTVASGNWNDAFSWLAFDEPRSGHTLDLSGLPPKVTASFDPDNEILALSDGSTDFIIGDSGASGSQDRMLRDEQRPGYVRVTPTWRATARRHTRRGGVSGRNDTRRAYRARTPLSDISSSDVGSAPDHLWRRRPLREL